MRRSVATPKPCPTQAPSRRHLFTTVAALPALAIRVPGADPDAEIKRLFRLWYENERRYMTEVIDDDISDEVSEDIANIAADFCHRIAAITPETIEGFAIKVYLMMKENGSTSYANMFDVITPTEEEAVRYMDAALEAGVYRDVKRFVTITKS